MDRLQAFFDQLDSIIWGAPLLILLCGVGLFYTIALRGIQFRKLGYALRLAFSKTDTNEKGDITHFQSLMTTLAGTIGIGSITGVATAIAVGGVGALFWMWVAGVIGMATRFAESVLAVKYRETDEKGEMCGGPMYYLEKGLGLKWLGIFFAVVGAITAIGTGNMIQAHSVSHAFSELCSLDPWITGVGLALLTAVPLFRGIQSIGRVASYIVPAMAIFYLLTGLVLVSVNVDRLGDAFIQIFSCAFNGQAATGGFVGASVVLAIQMGMSRGVFSSEAGLGSSPIASAAAKTDVPGRQALISMTGIFFTTCVVCTITGLMIALSGVLGDVDANGQVINGSVLTIHAFDALLPGSGKFVMFSLIPFAYSTILGWAYYGEKCIEYLFGLKSVRIYRCVYVLAIIPGALVSLNLIWTFANAMNGLMALPNLVGVILLAPVVLAEARTFAASLKKAR